MKKISRITLAQKALTDFFESTEKLVYTQADFFQLIERSRGAWGLPQTTPPKQIVQKWLTAGLLKSHDFGTSEEEHHILYWYGDPSIYEIAAALRPRSYISHYPAVLLHELTTQVPKTIYVTQEQSKKPAKKSTLTQEGMDHAFGQPQRRSQQTLTYKEYTVVFLQGMFTARTGVLLSSRYRNAFSLTSLERTLIDITVRPNYAGGAFAVLDAYARALSRLSTNKLLALLNAIPFIYPYHQAIGFYLERAGYGGRALDSLQQRGLDYRFYLDYGMEDPSFDKRWQLWHPKGM